VHKTTTRIVGNPSDAVVGEPAGVEVEITGLRSPVSMRMRSSPDAAWVTAVPRDVGLLPGTAYFRGVATRAEVEVCSWGPLGLIGYSRTSLLDLRRTLWIGPRPRAPKDPLDIEPRTGPLPAGPVVAAGEGDITRSVREYVPGDPLRRVAWSVTAHTGKLVTRELERPATHVVHLVVDLGTERGETAERVASVAAWAGRQLLGSGVQLSLTAMGPEGPATSVVNTVGLQRRLAETAPGTPPRPEGVPVLVVSAEGVAWH
ncbi:MAG TPA: DUF58 domain-containing protein, partial [Acidimicrobiales bacterium]|nr:DUF58 domain-containing protein [Acidimicrobiales bacterium]